MKLKSHPQQNVDTFGDAVYEKAKRIDGSGAGPADLSMLVAKTFLNCDVPEFALQASLLFNDMNKDYTCMDWRDVITQHKTTYSGLKSKKMWTPAATTKQAAMANKINTLKQQVATLKAKTDANTGASQSSGNERTCHGCGAMDHLVADCPNKNSS